LSRPRLQNDEHRGGGKRTRKIIGYLLRLIISAGLIYYIFSRQETSIANVAGQLRALDLSRIMLGLLGCKVCLLIGSYRWQILMKAHNIEVSFAHSLALNYLGLFFNNFMLSLTGGDIVKAYYASKLEHTKRATSATIVFLDRVIGFTALVFMGGISVLAAAGKEGAAIEFLVVIAGVMGCMLLGLVVFNRKVARALGRIIIFKKLKPSLRKVYDAVYYYKKSKKTLLLAFLISIALWCFLILVNVVVGNGLGIDRPPAYYFTYIPVIILISSAPVSVRGWGIREYFYGKFFGFEYGPTLSIIFALLEVAWSLVGGILFALQFPMKKWNRPGMEKTME